MFCSRSISSYFLATASSTLSDWLNLYPVLLICSIILPPNRLLISSSDRASPPSSTILACRSSIICCCYFYKALLSDSALASMNWSSSGVYSLLTLGLFLIYLARDPKFKVDSVSPSLEACGDTVIIKHVLEFPPIDSDKIRVNFESL